MEDITLLVLTFAGINFRDRLGPKLSRMVPFRNFAGINFRDRMTFWWNSLDSIFGDFDRYFDNSHESYISRVMNFVRTPKKKSRNRIP